MVGAPDQVRVSQITPKTVGTLPSPNKKDSPLAYILHFASIAGGKKSNFGSGPRWDQTGCLGPGTTFTLTIRQLRNIPDDTEILFGKAVTAFQHYGSIGMRVTRGMGAVQATVVTSESFTDCDQMLTSAGFTMRMSNRAHQDWVKVMEEAGKWLKNDLRKEFGAGDDKNPKASALGSIQPALGSIQPVRQTSAVYLRPIKLDGQLIFSAFEAPHHKILGERSKQMHSQPVLETRDFTEPPPLGR